MGISIDKSLKLQKHFASILNEIYREAPRFHCSHKEILNSCDRRIYNHPEYKKVPYWVVSYLQGCRDTLTKHLYMHLEWRKFVPMSSFNLVEVADKIYIYSLKDQNKKFELPLQCKFDNGLMISIEESQPLIDMGYTDLNREVDCDKSAFCYRDRPDKRF